jgi:hypothetical protein
MYLPPGHEVQEAGSTAGKIPTPIKPENGLLPKNVFRTTLQNIAAGHESGIST